MDCNDRKKQEEIDNIFKNKNSLKRRKNKGIKV